MKNFSQNKWIRTLAYGLVLGILSAVVMIFDQLVNKAITSNTSITHILHGRSFAYIAFIGWPLFYLGGSNVKGTIKAFISTLLGITAAILMNLFSGWFGGLGFMAAPLGVGLVVVPVMLLEKNKWTSYIPALFATCGVFFATMGVTKAGYTMHDYWLVASVQIPYILFGFAMGGLSIVALHYGNKMFPKAETKKTEETETKE